MTASDLVSSSSAKSSTSTRITNPQQLRLIRLAWVFLMAFGVAIYIINFPAKFTLMRDSERWAGGYRDVLAQIGMSADFYAAYFMTVESALFVLVIVLAIIVFLRRSDDWMALYVWLPFIYNILSSPPLTQVTPYWGIIIASIGMPLYICLWLIFPDGRFVPRWTRWLPYILVLGIVLYVPFYVMSIIGYQVTSPYLELEVIGFFLAIAILFFSQTYRYFKVSTPVQRQQTKWVLLGALLSILGTLIYVIVPAVFPETANSATGVYTVSYSLPSLIWMFISVPLALYSMALVPFAIGFSILRYRLWDVDLLLNRSLVYAVVSLMGLAIFFAALLGVQVVVGNTQPLIAAVIALVVTGVLFNPARRFAQRFVDRYIYRFRYDLNAVAAAQKLPEIKNPGALSGRKLDQYEVLDVIGKGGMGEVYKAQADGQIVALKILPDDLAAKEDYVKRFTREAQTLMTLQHPYIVKFFGSGKSDNIAYMAMEYIDGRELGERIKRDGALPLDESCDILKSLAEALDYAHERGFIHRDIKPSNVMLRRSKDGETWQAVLMDFGVAKIRDAQTGLTSTGAIGTIEYMAPEQIMAAKEVGSGADIYALGVLMYEILTGERPFKGSTGQIVFAHLQQPAPDPRDITPDIPRATANAILRALAKNPEDRFSTASEFVSAFVPASAEN